jgi:predicted ribosomally synthesized peptide with nif11-like leader
MIMPINRNKLTKEMIEKALKCQTADELIALAKAEGYDVTKDEAEAYMAELADFELDDAMLENAAGGGLFEYVRDTNKKIAKGLQDWIAG